MEERHIDKESIDDKINEIVELAHTAMSNLKDVNEKIEESIKDLKEEYEKEENINSKRIIFEIITELENLKRLVNE